MLVQVQTNEGRCEEVVPRTHLISDWLACFNDGEHLNCHITHKGKTVAQNQTFEDTNIQDGDVLRLVQKGSFNFGLAAGVKGKTNGGGKAPAFKFGYARTKQPARKSSGSPPPRRQQLAAVEPEEEMEEGDGDFDSDDETNPPGETGGEAGEDLSDNEGVGADVAAAGVVPTSTCLLFFLVQAIQNYEPGLFDLIQSFLTYSGGAANAVMAEFLSDTSEMLSESRPFRRLYGYSTQLHYWIVSPGLGDTPYTMGEQLLAGWNSADDRAYARGEEVRFENIADAEPEPGSSDDEDYVPSDDAESSSESSDGGESGEDLSNEESGAAPDAEQDGAGPADEPGPADEASDGSSAGKRPALRLWARMHKEIVAIQTGIHIDGRSSNADIQEAQRALAASGAAPETHLYRVSERQVGDEQFRGNTIFKVCCGIVRLTEAQHWAIIEDDGSLLAALYNVVQDCDLEGNYQQLRDVFDDIPEDVDDMVVRYQEDCHNLTTYRTHFEHFSAQDIVTHISEHNEFEHEHYSLAFFGQLGEEDKCRCDTCGKSLKPEEQFSLSYGVVDSVMCEEHFIEAAKEFYAQAPSAAMAHPAFGAYSIPDGSTLDVEALLGPRPSSLSDEEDDSGESSDGSESGTAAASAQDDIGATPDAEEGDGGAASSPASNPNGDTCALCPYVFDSIQGIWDHECTHCACRVCDDCCEADDDDEDERVCNVCQNAGDSSGGGGAAAYAGDDSESTLDAEGDSSDGSGSEDEDEELSRSQLRAWAAVPANKSAAAVLGHVINGNSSNASIVAAMDAVQEQVD